MPIKFPFRLRDIMPRGLYARSVLIAAVPLVILIALMTYYFFDSHIRSVNRKMSQGVAGDIALIVNLARNGAALTEADPLPTIIRDTTRHQVNYLPGASLPDEPSRTQFMSFFSLDEPLLQELEVSLDTPFWVDTGFEGDRVDIQVLLEGGVLQVLVDRKRAFATTGHIFIVWVILLSLFLLAVSISFMRNQVRSILRLTKAADELGRGQEAIDFKPSGATEIREAAVAVLEMRDRIKAHADQRTAMLASISHDLRTPLTRLKLELALPDKSRDLKAAKGDLDEMSAMLDEYLAFARGEEGEVAAPTDLVALVRNVAGSLSDRADIGLDAVAHLPHYMVRPLAVKRAITNLVANASDYADTVRISLVEADRGVTVHVDDNGPGIPADRQDEVFKPFARLDAARNQNAPGVGLGLAIARDVARSHGGDVELGTSPLGGLRATLSLPV